MVKRALVKSFASQGGCATTHVVPDARMNVLPLPMVQHHHLVVHCSLGIDFFAPRFSASTHTPLVWILYHRFLVADWVLEDSLVLVSGFVEYSRCKL